MHYKCFDAFYAASVAAESPQRLNLSLDIARGEAMCPLCKALVTGLVPYVPISTAKKSFESDGHSTVDAVQSSASSPRSRSIAGSTISSIKERVNTKQTYLDRLRTIPSVTSFARSLFIDMEVDQFVEGEEAVITPVITRPMIASEAKEVQSKWMSDKSKALSLYSSSKPSSTRHVSASLYPRELEEPSIEVDSHYVGEGEERRFHELVLQMVLVARNARNWMSPMYDESVVWPLQRLLAGVALVGAGVVGGGTAVVREGLDLLESTDKSPPPWSTRKRKPPCALVHTSSFDREDCEELLLSVPTKVIGTNGFPSPVRLYGILNICQRRGVASSRL
eukprot:gene5841-7454_t